MRIVFLIENAAQLWGGTKVVLEDANRLTARGHRVTVVSTSGKPAWMEIHCDFLTVKAFSPETIPASDIVVGTFWTTVTHAIQAASRPGAGAAVHFCQGYEGDNPENAAVRDQIEAVYRDDSAFKITISSHLTGLLKERFDCNARQITYVVDHEVMYPGPQRAPGQVRIGLVGPYQIAWKDISTGLEACALAHRAGLDLQLVRVTNTTPHPDEQNLPFPVEWHEQVPPADMGEIYRSMDVFLGSSRGAEEGFFLPAVEAMACGVPCVLTEIPCFRGYGDGQYALFAEPGDALQIAEALVVAGKHPDVATQLRQCGIDVAKRYTPENHIDDMERAFGEILTESRAQATTTPSEVIDVSQRIQSRTDTPAAPTASDEELAGISSGLISSMQVASDLYMDRGEYREAVNHLQAALCIRPDDERLLADLARAHYVAGEDRVALDLYTRLLQSHDDADLHASRAMVLFSMGDYSGAVQSFVDAVRCGAPSTELLNNMGVAQCQAGDREGARQSFEQALTIEPGHADATANLQSLAG